MHGVNTLLPGKQRFTLQYFKNWKAEASGTQNANTDKGGYLPEINSSSRVRGDKTRSGGSGSQGPKNRSRVEPTTGHNSMRGSKKGNRSFGEGNVYYSMERPGSKKMFRDDTDLVGAHMTSGKGKRESTEHSVQSPSFIEEISGGSAFD